MKNLVLLFTLFLIHGCGCTGVFAQTGPGIKVPGTIFPGRNIIDTNYVKAPQPYNASDVNSTNMAVSSATLVRNTTTGDLFQGLPVWTCDASALNGYCEFKLNTINSPHKADANCSGLIWYKGDATLYSAEVVGTSTRTILIGTNNTGDYRMAEPIVLPCQSTVTVRVKQTVAGTAPAIQLGWVGYGGLYTYAGKPENTFTAKVSSTGIVTDETGGDWINGNCSLAGSSFTCNYVSGVFTQSPTCFPSQGFSAYNQMVSAGPGPTAVIVVTGVSSASSATSFSVTCTKTGSDNVQPVVSAANWNYSPRPYTPTFTGFGTVTNVDCTEARDGGFNVIDCKFTTGTATATEARVSLPGSILSVTYPQGIRSAQGDLLTNTSASTYFGTKALIESSVGYITFGNQGSASNPFTKINGSAIGNSVLVSFTARVQIQGWLETYNALQLIGSVTSNYAGALNFFSGVMNGNCTASPCALAWSAGITNVTRVATGSYQINVPAGSCSAFLSCSFNGNQPLPLWNGSTNLFYAVVLRNIANADSDGTFTFNCSCPR